MHNIIDAKETSFHHKNKCWLSAASLINMIMQLYLEGLLFMKRVLLAATLAVVAAPVLAADVGVSISINQPGFYGRVDLGNSPKPEVIYDQPVIIHGGPSPTSPEPIYLHVPPGYEKHWRRHCRQYNACGRPVYFVRDKWYRESYAPHHHGHEKNRDDRRDEHHGEGPGRDHHDHDQGHDHDRD